MPTKKTTIPRDPEKRVEAYTLEEQKLRDKYRLDRRILIVFQDSSKVPILGKLAGLFLKWSRGRVEVFFVEKK